MLYQSSFTGAGSAIIFENLNIYNMYAGMAGVQGGGNVENCLLINVGFSTCGLYGLWMTGQNVVNWQVYGGGASACGWLSTFAPGANTGIMGGAYYGGVGAIGCLYGLSCTGNQWDCMNDGGQQMHVAGGSFEGGPNLTVDLSWSAGTVTATTNPAYPHKLKFDQPISIFKVSGPASYGGHFTAHITGPTTFTYPLVSNPGATAFAVEAPTNAGCILCNGSAISVDGIAYRVYDTAMARSVYCAGGTVSVNGSLIAAAGDSGTGIIAEMVNGIITIDGTIIETYQDGTFKSAGASELYLKGIIWVPYPTNPFSGFAGGVVREFYKYNASTVADLPAASAIFKGLRSSVTDGAASLAWGATVTGGGSAFYDVVCNGSAWTVTGK
jgi:hypothetical protein